jgi:formate C-acetyltransferase
VNYKKEAERLLSEEKCEKRRFELERIIAALGRVPFEPAETLFEAVQTMLLFHFSGLLVSVNSNMMGRVDFFLDEYYKKDIELGRVKPEEASEWMQYVYAKSSELVNLGDAMTIGGCYLDGKPFWSDLTYFILDALKALKHHQPQVGFRYAKGMPEELLRRAFMPLLHGVPQPGFFDDDITVASLEGIGFSTRDARNYVNCACVELSSYGCSDILSGYTYHNIAKPLEALLNKGKQMIEERDIPHAWTRYEFPEDIPVEYASFEEFQESYRLYLGYLVKKLVERTNGHLSRKLAAAYPLPSVLIEDCIETGVAVTDGGARYKQTFPNFVGLVTAADSLSAIRQCVYEDKKLTLEELADVCRNNFEGHEDTRLYLLNKCPKFGNGDKKADEMVKWVYDLVAEELGKHDNIYGIKYAPCYFGEMQYVLQAHHTAATPDGRRLGEAVTPTLGGDQGRDRTGMTALINSVTAFDHTLSPGGLSANFAVSPLSLKSEEDIDMLISALLTYFEKGGMQAQFNHVSGEKLRNAQENPENHRNLLVRVAGFSGYFVNQVREIQDQLIERTEHALR